VGALQSALKRLEDKGYLKSFEGEATEERAGRPKKYFQITALGKRRLWSIRRVRGMNCGVQYRRWLGAQRSLLDRSLTFFGNTRTIVTKQLIKLNENKSSATSLSASSGGSAIRSC
jgi:DNA-binding PadR family transcriptional regulator